EEHQDVGAAGGAGLNLVPSFRGPDRAALRSSDVRAARRALPAVRLSRAIGDGAAVGLIEEDAGALLGPPLPAASPPPRAHGARAGGGRDDRDRERARDDQAWGSRLLHRWDREGTTSVRQLVSVQRSPRQAFRATKRPHFRSPASQKAIFWSHRSIR